MCRFISAAEENEEAHIGHLWVFSPPFFILVLDVKAIVHSKKFAATSRQCNVVIFSVSYVLYQSYGPTEKKIHEFPEENEKIIGVSLPFLMKVKVE